MKRTKRIICLLLAFLCVLPLAACGADVAEKAPVALMSREDLWDLSANGKVFEGTTEEESDAIWENAATIVEAWYAEYLVMKQEDLSKYTTSYKKLDSKEYPRSYYSNTQIGQFSHSSNNLRPTRTVESLTGWLTSTYFDKEYELDVYGGWKNEAMKQEATGNFYVKKLGTRWYYIDPLGYPCIAIGVVGPLYSYAGNEQQRAACIQKYGSEEKWAIATVRDLKDDYGFNLAMPHGGDAFLEVPEGMIYQKSTTPLTEYGRSINMVDQAGSTYFDGDAMPVFDPMFPEFVDTYVKETVTPLLNDTRIVGFTSDNEIPIEKAMLDNYMVLDPDAKPIHRYSYATAWTWLSFMTGKNNPTAADVTDELRELFRGFVYYRYFSVIALAFRKYAPNYMYGGVRFYTPEAKATVLDAEWVVRFAGKYCDYICINWYRRYWTLTPELAADLTKWSGDKPFVITEFYAKCDLVAGDTDTKDVTAAGGGGGWHVDGYGKLNGADMKVGTHQARADYYENSALAFLEWGSIIGWHWYRYNHYYMGGGLDRAGGIVSDDHVMYPEFEKAFEDINNHVYGLAEYFDERNGK